MARETIAREEAVTETPVGLADVRQNDVGDLRLALARAVAARKVPDDAILAVAKTLAAGKNRIRGIDVCIYGICIDYFFEGDQWIRALPELVRGKDARVYSVEAFPWGIPWPDLFRVRVQAEFDQFAGYNPNTLGDGARQGASLPGLGSVGGVGGVRVQ